MTPSATPGNTPTAAGAAASRDAANAVAGLLLAAGAGRRYGMPKALVDGGGWLRHTIKVLTRGGCDPVLVVLGARADEAAALLPPGVIPVVAPDWAEGMSASLRAGVEALRAREWEMVSQHHSPLTSVVVHLVDLPDVGADVVRRLVGMAAQEVVARAAYGGRPGHPVLIGREHWGAVVREASGDSGAKAWLAHRADLRLVDCTDLATGRDHDTPDSRLA